MGVQQQLRQIYEDWLTAGSSIRAVYFTQLIYLILIPPGHVAAVYYRFETIVPIEFSRIQMIREEKLADSQRLEFRDKTDRPNGSLNYVCSRRRVVAVFGK